VAFAASLARETGAEMRYVHQNLAELSGAEGKVAALGAADDGIDVLINNAAPTVNRPFREFSLPSTRTGCA
jgi:short-subunit dehydrogenase